MPIISFKFKIIIKPKINLENLSFFLKNENNINFQYTMLIFKYLF